MGIIRRVFDFKSVPVLTAVFVILFIAEGRRPLRKRKRSRAARIVTNTIFSIPAFTLLRLVLLPVMVLLARKNKQLRIGLNYGYSAPPLIKSLLAFLLLDYSNYAWHILNHRLPQLWRFHLVHHSDEDLDITTAFRFHSGEMVGSIFYRGACVFLSGASPLTVLLYETAFEAATQFHHSNWKLPLKIERGLNKFMVTPRMHGIHHSDIQEQTDSNYSVIFSFWDRMHHTSKLNVGQEMITIGSPFHAHRQFTVAQLLTMPFGAEASIKKGKHTRPQQSPPGCTNTLAD
ncbi:MAG: sterol desaturase family protein [Chitinophagaceae bacterium]